jgi:RNA polymerase sigma-70 factor (ECF subfamily)
MHPPARSEITRILQEISAEDSAHPARTDELFALIYGELRRIAAGLLRRERPEHTLQPTALVHEAYLKLVDQTRIRWQDRAHFLGIAARAMRQILVDHARGRAARKRGGGRQRVTLDEALVAKEGKDLELLSLDEAMTRLAGVDERAARVVELRIFGGLTVTEIAHVLGVSKRTVDGDWSVARMWLARELRPEAGA